MAERDQRIRGSMRHPLHSLNAFPYRIIGRTVRRRLFPFQFVTIESAKTFLIGSDVLRERGGLDVKVDGHVRFASRVRPEVANIIQGGRLVLLRAPFHTAIGRKFGRLAARDQYRKVAIAIQHH